MSFFVAYQPVFDQVLVYSILAYSQYVVMRAGVFSVATVGIAAIGAYCTAILTVRYGVSPLAATAAATILGSLAGVLIAIPLARLRGIYQAMVTIAMVKVIGSLIMYFEGLTGGVLGFNNIPKSYGTWFYVLICLAVIVLLYRLFKTGAGRAFDAIRQEETVALSLGISVRRHHTLAFAISGALAGLGGDFIAHFGRSLFPAQFGFELLTEVLAFVILGGITTILGPLVGTAILVVLPEFARPLSDNTLLFYGAVLVIVMIYLPHGVVDTIALRLRRRRLARRLDGTQLTDLARRGAAP